MRRSRLIDSAGGDLPRAHGVDEELRLLGAAELIDAGVHRFGEAIALRELLDAPRHRHSRESRTFAGRSSVAANLRAVVGDRPVGEDHAIESVRFRSMSVSSCRLKPAPTCSSGRPFSRALENRVSRHHAGDVRRERAEEWPDVRLKILGGESRPFAVARVAVAAVLLRAVADPVLHHRQHAGRSTPAAPCWNPSTYARTSFRARSASSPKVPLIRLQRGSVARSACGESVSWMPTARYSWRAMSAKRRTSRVAYRGEAERLGPLRESARLDARAEDVLEMISGIGADGERNAESRALGDLLQLVVLRGQRSRVPPRRVIKLLTPTSRISLPVAARS